MITDIVGEEGILFIIALVKGMHVVLVIRGTTGAPVCAGPAQA